MTRLLKYTAESEVQSEVIRLLSVELSSLALPPQKLVELMLNLMKPEFEIEFPPDTTEVNPEHVKVVTDALAHHVDPLGVELANPWNGLNALQAFVETGTFDQDKMGQYGDGYLSLEEGEEPDSMGHSGKQRFLLCALAFTCQAIAEEGTTGVYPTIVAAILTLAYAVSGLAGKPEDTSEQFVSYMLEMAIPAIEKAAA